MNSWQLKLFKHAVEKNGIVAYPTEAVYGLGCDPYSGYAVSKLLSLKKRSIDKGLILIASDIGQLLPFLKPLNKKDIKRLEQSWPGPITFVLPANGATPDWLIGQRDTIAVRVTSHPVAKLLCHTLGHPLVSTSANPAGLPPAKSALHVRRYFGNAVNYIVYNNSQSTQASPTEIRMFCTGKVIR